MAASKSLLEHGRASFDRHAWGDAFEALARAEGDAPLDLDDLADAIVDRILERGRLLRLDGPSVRTKHLPENELTDHDQDNSTDRRISGKRSAEFPERTEVLIDYEEGRELFPNLATWQNPRNYPALRVRSDNPAFPCMFYDEATAGCLIYEERPHMCRSFTCDWLKHVLEVL